MRSFQNLLLLKNLYRLKAAGFSYIDPLVINTRTQTQLPERLAPLHKMISQCHLCDLSKSRRQAMSGQGSPKARLMIVDYCVSTAEDESNRYFAGRSGDSLQKMIENVLEMPVEEVYLTHAVKCKPTGSKLPSRSEWESCKAYLFKQIEIVSPEVIVTLGPDAYRLLSGDDTPFEQVRGTQIAFADASLIPIHHPAFLLRNPSLKRATLNDLHTVKSAL